MESDTYQDFSLKNVDRLKSHFFPSPLPDESLKRYRKINSNFFEAVAFYLLEKKIVSYDANDYMNFLEYFKEELSKFHKNSQNSQNPLTKDLDSLFDSIAEFLEHLNDLLLNSVMTREETLQFMIQTFEDSKNRLIKGIGLFHKATLINFAQSKTDDKTYLSDNLSKYLDKEYFEKHIEFPNILNELRLICEIEKLNLSMISEKEIRSYHFAISQKDQHFLYMNENYYILYSAMNYDPEKVIPLPPADIRDLMTFNYMKDESPKILPLFTENINNTNQINKNMNKINNLNYINDNENLDDHDNTNKNLKIDMEINDPSLICCLCHLKILEKMFINPICAHRFCNFCLVDKTQQKNCSSICYETRCVQSINFKELEDYLIEMNLSKQFEEETIIEKMTYFCSKCQNEEIVCFSGFLGPEFLFCGKCKDFQCLIHNDSMENCQCFCRKCKQKMEDFTIIRQKICRICQENYCSMCGKEKSLCKCFCEVCFSIKNLEKEECDNCKRECVNCHVIYGEDLLDLGDCGKHWVCRCCIVREACEEKKIEEWKKCKYCEDLKKNESNTDKS